jgi:hypothetical protein
MRRRQFRFIATAVVLWGVATGAAAVATSSPSSETKSCSPSYVHANLSWGEKCLRTGEFCKVGNVEYHQYGFDCPTDGHLVFYSGSGSASGSPPNPGGRAVIVSGGSCGVERWTVKTLQDRPKLLPVQPVSIRDLVNRRPPADLPYTRLPFERHVFRVNAAVTLVRPEEDGDLHLVLSDGTRTMIAESPSSSCTAGGTPLRRRQMAQARTHVRLCAKASLTGVAFFDFTHGQTGVAPNAIELHPLLGFRCSA